VSRFYTTKLAPALMWSLAICLNPLILFDHGVPALNGTIFAPGVFAHFNQLRHMSYAYPICVPSRYAMSNSLWQHEKKHHHP